MHDRTVTTNPDDLPYLLHPNMLVVLVFFYVMIGWSIGMSATRDREAGNVARLQVML